MTEETPPGTTEFQALIDEFDQGPEFREAYGQGDLEAAELIAELSETGHPRRATFEWFRLAVVTGSRGHAVRFRRQMYLLPDEDREQFMTLAMEAAERSEPEYGRRIRLLVAPRD